MVIDNWFWVVMMGLEPISLSKRKTRPLDKKINLLDLKHHEHALQPQLMSSLWDLSAPRGIPSTVMWFQPKGNGFRGVDHVQERKTCLFCLKGLPFKTC